MARTIKLVGGSSLSDGELWDIARDLIDDHGADAEIRAAEQLAEADAAGNNAEYATWVNVILCLIQLSRPLTNEPKC